MKSIKQLTSGPILVTIGIVAVIALLAFSGSSTPTADTSTSLEPTYGTPVLNIPAASADLGDVSMRDGVAENVFALKNDGDGPLRIGALETSCMCTTARLEVDGGLGPIYGMPGHGRSSRNWAMDIPEGGEGILHVYYDPNAHGPAGVGPFTRVISFTTNDSDAPEASVRVSGITVR